VLFTADKTKALLIDVLMLTTIVKAVYTTEKHNSRYALFHFTSSTTTAMTAKHTIQHELTLKVLKRVANVTQPARN